MLFLTTYSNTYSQETEFKRSSIKTGLGLATNLGKKEVGSGFAYSFGWQKSYGKNNKLRINPCLVMGEFYPYLVKDLPDMFYRTTNLEMNVHYDLIRYKSVSLVTSCGIFLGYSRGLIGTGGYGPPATQSKYFFNYYIGGNFSVGFRIDPPKSKIAYEIRPMNFNIGSNNFAMFSVMFGIDFKFKK